ncbi:MAG: hypothetical protein J6A67_09520 [Clostridia bacterium]|nr:hypothetical protein [Clostridia bacterium]
MFAMQTHHSRSEHHSSYPHSGCIIAKASPLLYKPEFDNSYIISVTSGNCIVFVVVCDINDIK